MFKKVESVYDPSLGRGLYRDEGGNLVHRSSDGDVWFLPSDEDWANELLEDLSGITAEAKPQTGFGPESVSVNTMLKAIAVAGGNVKQLEL